MRLRLLATLAAFVWIPAAQAHTMVWFETPNANGQGPGSHGGAPGLPLNLLCYPPPVPSDCTWQIQMKAALSDAGVLSWSLDLRTALGNGVTISNPQIAPSPFTSNTSHGTTGTGAALLQTAHGWTFIPPPPQTVTLLTFTLRRTLAAGDLTSAAILGGPSASPEWGPWINNSGEYGVVQFGPNPPAPGVEGTFGFLPLIWMGTPEPASLSLLTLGSVVVLMRRRAQSP